MVRIPDLLSNPMVDFDHMTIIGAEQRKRELEKRPDAPSTLEQQRQTVESLVREKIVSRLGAPRDAHVYGLSNDVPERVAGERDYEKVCEELGQGASAYFTAIRDLIGSERLLPDDLREFLKRVKRGKIDITPPPPPPNKKALGHKFPLFSSAMHSIWPGDVREHREFLRSHNGYYRPPESIASKGGVFVTPPRLSPKETIALIDKLHACHPVWREPPHVKLTSTKGEVTDLLQHYDVDFPVAVVKEIPGEFAEDGSKRVEFLGYVDKQMMQNLGDKALVESFYSTDKPLELPLNMPAMEGYKMLKQRRRFYAFNFEKGRPLVRTRKTDAAAHLLPAFEHEGGLGCVVYIGPDDEELIANLDEIVAHKPAGIIAETANMHRPDTIYDFLHNLHAKYKQLWIGAGTVSNPLAIPELAEYVDAVKCGVANGTLCLTKKIGKEDPDGYAIATCGAVAKGLVSIIADNGSNPRRFTKILGVDECIGAQFGTSLIMRRDSANPIIVREGVPGKEGNGEASLNAVLRNMEGKPLTIEQEMQAELGLHTEGRSDDWGPLRTPDTFAEFFSELGSAARAGIAYTGFDSLAKYQNGAEFGIVRQPI